MGPIRITMTHGGQTPPIPALIGKNRMPAPAAVPNRLGLQLMSWRIQPARAMGGSVIVGAASRFPFVIGP